MICFLLNLIICTLTVSILSLPLLRMVLLWLFMPPVLVPGVSFFAEHCKSQATDSVFDGLAVHNCLVELDLDP